MSISTKAPNAEKGKRYFGLLDQALCNGNWSEVPELARKTDKHAPGRRCFTLTARTEAQIASSAPHRPTSAPSTRGSSDHSLSAAIPKLLEAIDASSSSSEDARCASTCLAEIYWLQQDPAASLRALPTDSSSPTSSKGLAPLGWLEVCAAKCAFFRLAALEATGRNLEAKNGYLAAVAQTPGSQTPEWRRWRERLLARACMQSVEFTQQPQLPMLDDSLRAFRAWADFWQRVSPPATDTPRRVVWKAYYDLVSNILEHGIMYSPDANLLIDSKDEHSVPAKTRQLAELKRVEASYESLLLGETQFPKASERNTEVEEWVQQAVANWKILCGPSWTDAALGEGDKESVSRGMLDILYRAATKTFHSTAILRHLFYVHSTLGEFDLAMHAFDSYVEIIGKGKARAEKTGAHELGADNDDSALITAADAVSVLCKYGDREQGEKALQVAKTIRNWLAKSSLQPVTLAAAYRALGVCQAHWARLTHDVGTRDGLQAEAVQNLRQAYTHDPHSVETSYALASVLAETQQVSAAIEVAKRSIALAGTDSEVGRRALPLWHLLSLCLTTRDEYEQAYRMCEAALDLHSHDVAEHMDTFDKEAMLQLKMSQLTFTELTEGANTAVDSADELLSLYAQLFGTPERTKAPTKVTPTAGPPSRSALRSIVGSIRTKSARNSVERGPPAAAATEPALATVGHDFDAPVAITVTNEDGHRRQDHHLHLPFKIRGHHGDHRDTRSLRSEESAEKLGGKEDKVIRTEPQMQQGVSQQPLKSMQHNAAHNALPPPAGHDDQPPEQDVRLPAPHSLHLSNLQERQHQTSILVKVWLFIASLYIRADLYDDAGGAINEATRTVEALETDKTTARNLFEKGWGGGQSVDELWADVHSARGALASARELSFDALSRYETALAYFPDHPDGIVGVSELLMDTFEGKMPSTDLAAARDRAYMLLSNLTKLGTGWDNSAAWLSLARAYELSGQMDKAKQALWWVVELEESQPMRPWRCITGGYVV